MRRGQQERDKVSRSQEVPTEYASGLQITVLFTTVPGTLQALRRAASLAFQLEASIRILVVQAVPYPLPVDTPQVKPEFRLRQFHALWEQEPIETRIDVRLCRDKRQCIHDALAPHSLVLMGSGRSWWPLTREKRLARSLRRAGHHLIPVVEGCPTPTSTLF